MTPHESTYRIAARVLDINLTHEQAGSLYNLALLIKEVGEYADLKSIIKLHPDGFKKVEEE